MITSRTLRFSPAQRRTWLTSLFGLTFLASVFTVSASNVLPCPAHITRGRYADGEGPEDAPAAMRQARVVVEKRPRRWIEEKPTARQT